MTIDKLKEQLVEVQRIITFIKEHKHDDGVVAEYANDSNLYKYRNQESEILFAIKIKEREQNG